MSGRARDVLRASRQFLTKQVQELSTQSKEMQLTDNDMQICEDTFKAFETTVDGYPSDSEIVCLSFGYAEVFNDGCVIAFGQILHIFE